MQIDFHYNVIYILCRTVGYNETLSLRIARASQYVDDSTEPGKVQTLSKIITAHKMFDHSNLRIEDQIKIWLPFHFPPGFRGNNLFDKSIVQPDSFSINRIMSSLQEKQNENYFPEYLGIFLHVLADSFSHQGFSPFLSDRNDLELINGHPPFKWISFLPDWLKNYVYMLMKFLPVGHLTVNTNPDLPYKKWSYKTGRMIDETLIDNTKRFDAAVDKVKDILILNFPETFNNQNFQQLNPLPKIKEILTTTQNGNPLKRHKIWQQKILTGHFGFIPETDITYSEQQIESNTEFLLNFHRAAADYKNYFHANITNELFKLGLDDRLKGGTPNA